MSLAALEIIEVENAESVDETEHIACVVCYPVGYIGRMKAFCGLVLEFDVMFGLFTEHLIDNACSECVENRTCPVCGLVYD